MPDAQPKLPDDALVVRGGKCLPENFAELPEDPVEETKVIDDVSVNSYPGVSVRELTLGNSQTGYPGIPNTLIGVTTVGEIRKAGGEVTPSPSK